MRINPVLYKHLMVNASQKRFYWLMTIYLAVISLLMLGIFSLNLTLGSPIPQTSLFFSLGRTVYWTSSVLMLLTVAMLTPTAALLAFSSEREQRTWDLLKVTTLPARSILLGKLGGTLASGALYLLAPLPLLMTGYWLGGVTFTELAITVVFIGVVMISTSSLGLWISLRLKRTSWAVLAYYGFILALEPLAGFAAAFYSWLQDAWFYRLDVAHTSYFLEALIEHGWVVLSAIHPLISAFASIGLAEKYGSWLLLILPLRELPGATVTLPSPWIITVVFWGLVSLFLLRQSEKAIVKLER